MASEYKKSDHIGPGGLKCPCCTPGGSSHKNAKRHMVRAQRRRDKKVTQEELDAVHDQTVPQPEGD